MTRFFILLQLLLLATPFLKAQELIPFEFISEEENKFIKEDDSLKYYVASGDSVGYVVCINEDASYYKLLNTEQKVIAEGSYITDGDKYLQTGKWIQRYENGKTKISGSYRRNKPIGTWQEYYANGRVKIICNYAIVISGDGSTNYCLSGSWQEYYANGKLKVTGLYTANETAARDTIIVEDPITEKKIPKTIARTDYRSTRTGTWEYFSENGELDSKEEF